MGDDKETTTSTSNPTNPAVNNTLTNLLGSLGGVAAKGVPTFNQTLYPGAGDTTRGSWASMLSGANNPAFSAGIKGATADFADAAAGDQYGANDAYFAQKGDDTLRDVNAMFTNSGRFGSGSHVGTAAESLGRVNAENLAADRQWQAQAAGMLPSLYQAGLAPAGVQASVGAAQDADALARRQAEFDLHERQYGADWTNLGKAASIFGQLAGTGGQTMTTSSPATPWWMNAASVAGQFI